MGNATGPRTVYGSEGVSSRFQRSSKHRVIVVTVTRITVPLRSGTGDIPALAYAAQVAPVAARGKDLDASMCLAIPGQVIELVDEANRLAKVDVAGVRRNVNVGLLDDDGDGARPGDWVLIHVGFALSKVDEEEAHATLRLLERMGADYEQELEELKASVIE